MFKRMKIGIRLWLLVLVAVTALLAMAGDALLILRQTMLDDRQINARNVVETAYGVVAHYGDLAAAQKLDPQEAKAQALSVLRGLRYESEEYFWVNTIEPRMVMHPIKPELDGTDLSDFKDPNGKRIFVESANVAKRSGGGFVDYYWPKPGSDKPVEKISYVKLYEPWGWVVGSGVYLDDVDRGFKTELARISGFVLVALLAIGLVGTGIKLAGEVLYRLNRKLRAISSCNQILMRAEDEQTLLDDICRIVCDEAGYRMAWVGFAEHDDAKSIRPVAWAGVDSGYIANAKFSWADDAERGQGFAGKAIRSGETILVRDFAADPQTVQGRESALQHGYRSGIALPLKGASADIFGVLLIYSAGIDAISPDEKRLLEELAGDLAFGIVTQRTRAEHMRAEEALKESNAKYRRIVETASEGIWLVDHDIRTVFVNARMAEMLGYSGEEMIGRLFTDFMFEEDVLDHEQRIEHRRQGISESYERRFRRKDGRAVWTQASATAILDGEHRYTGSFAMFSDITERKRAEEALRESEAFLNSLLEAIPIPVFYKDKAGRYLGFNRAYETFFGATKDQLIGKSVFDISPRELAEIYFAKDRELFERGGVQQYESQVKNLRGEVRDVIFDKAVFADSQGTIIGLIGAILDITERKRTEVERMTNLHFFESMDRVNKAIQGTDDLQQMVSVVLENLLSICDCDRAFLVYPCDPETGSWRSVMERTGPEYPGAYVSGLEVPIDPDVIRIFKTLRATSGPVTFGAGSDLPLPTAGAEKFSFQSMVAMAICPKGDKPYMLGLHQCSSPRVWTPHEKTLLQEIGRRLADGLSIRLSLRKLQESEAKFRRIVDTAIEGIWVLGLDTMTTFVNARMAEMLGYSGEEMMGRSMTDFMFKEDVPDHQLKIEHRRQGLAENYERRFHRKDGRVVWTQASATAILDDEHRYTGSFAMFSDITERKRVEEALLKRKEELERFEKLVVGRELRMVELKSRIAQLDEALKTKKENDHES